MQSTKLIDISNQVCTYIFIDELYNRLLYQGLKICCSTHLNSQIKRGLSMKELNIPWQCDTRFCAFTYFYHSMIHLSSKVKLVAVTKWLHYCYNIGGWGMARGETRRGRKVEGGRNPCIYRNVKFNGIIT